MKSNLKENLIIKNYTAKKAKIINTSKGTNKINNKKLFLKDNRKKKLLK